MKVWAVTWTWVDWDMGSGGLSSIWATRELAEAELERLKKSDRENSFEIEEHEVGGLT